MDIFLYIIVELGICPINLWLPHNHCACYYDGDSEDCCYCCLPGNVRPVADWSF